MSRIYVEEQNIFYNVTPKITLIVDMLQLIGSFLNMLVICYAFIVIMEVKQYRNVKAKFSSFTKIILASSLQYDCYKC